MGRLSSPFLYLPLWGVLLAPVGFEIAAFALFGLLLLIREFFLLPSWPRVWRALKATWPLWPFLANELVQFFIPFPVLKGEVVAPSPFLPTLALILFSFGFFLWADRKGLSFSPEEGRGFWVWASLFLAVVGVYELLTGWGLYPWPLWHQVGSQSPYSLFGHRGFWSGGLLILLPWLLVLRAWGPLAFVAFALGAGGVRAVLLPLLLLPLFLQGGLKVKGKAFLVLILPFGLGFFSVSHWGAFLPEDPSLAGVEGLQRNTFSSRVVIWENILKDLKHRPWVGWHGQPTSGLYPHFMSESEFRSFSLTEGFPDWEAYVWCPLGEGWGIWQEEKGEWLILPPLPAHNLFLHMLGAYGWPLGLFFLGLWGLAILRSWGSPLALSLLAYGTYGMLWNPEDKVLLLVFLYILLALRGASLPAGGGAGKA